MYPYEIVEDDRTGYDLRYFNALLDGLESEFIKYIRVFKTMDCQTYVDMEEES